MKEMFYEAIIIGFIAMFLSNILISELINKYKKYIVLFFFIVMTVSIFWLKNFQDFVFNFVVGIMIGNYIYNRFFNNSHQKQDEEKHENEEMVNKNK